MTVRKTLLNTFDDLARVVDENDGVYTVSEWRLREMYGAERLGSQVRAGIKDKIDSLGLRLQTDLVGHQHALVRVYRRGSPVAEVIEAAGGAGKEEDAVLRRVASAKGAELVKKLRELLEEVE